MKVLQVVKTNRGAAWAFNQAKYLRKIGVQIITVLPNSHEGYAEKYKECGLEVIEGDWSLPISRPWKMLKKTKEIKRIINIVKPDIIHMHFVTNVIMCRLALRKDNTPRLFQVPGPLHLENKFTSFVERKIATKTDYWAGACNKTCSIYIDKGIDCKKIYLAYYGVPHKETSIKHSKCILRSEYNISDDTIVVAMVSYFYKPKKYLGQKRGIKGHEDFIDAMKIVVQKYSNVLPIIIGNAWDGSDKYECKVKKYAKRKLGEKIIFTGYRNDIYDIYPEINFVVHPSHSENLGGAAESLMLAIPTISSNVGGFPDIVIPEKTGMLVEPKNPIDLANKIIWAIENRNKMIEMANSGQELVNRLLDLDNTASRIYDVYSNILGINREEIM